MKAIYLVIFGLALNISCQQRHQNSSSSTVNLIPRSANPNLIAFQYLTVKLKKETGNWPNTKADYLKFFGDSAQVYLENFEEIKFRNSKDTLVVNYFLKDLNKNLNDRIDFTGNYQLELTSQQPNNDSSKYKFESTVELIKSNEEFKPNEGRFIFYETDRSITYISQEDGQSRVKNKITHAQH
jgi:hypothetical protein